MKTPREILLARHQAAVAKLDKVRRAVVAELSSPAVELEIPFLLKLWRELVLPKPQAWAAVAAMWVLIIGLKFSTQEIPQVSARKAVASPEVLAEVKQQKRLFAELAGLVETRVTLPTKPTPRPRSDRQLRILIG